LRREEVKIFRNTVAKMERNGGAAGEVKIL
jgi:hypothetical protein